MRINSQQLTAWIGRIGLTRFAQLVLIAWTVLAISLLSVWTSKQLLTDSVSMNETSAPRSDPPGEVFDSELLASVKIFGKPPRKPKPLATKPPPRTPTHWLLQGVFTGASPARGSAIITSQGQPAALYHTQQTLPGGAKLLEVHTDHVVLEQSGQKRTLQFPPISKSFDRISASPSIASRIGAPKKPNTERQNMARQRLEKLRQRALNRS